MRRFIGIVLFLLFAFSTSAQTDERPFILPMADPPGPDTWLFGQAYGNTVGAYNFGPQWYATGQGLHFGVDFPMPCGTDLVAVADGTVAFVDNLGLGAGPHNLVIRHDQYEVAVLYGHLLEAPPLMPGQAVTQGQIIGQSGDPDVTCDSRPHLHFEVRSQDFFTTYNPVEYIDANWHSLAVAGGYSYPLFQQDLFNADQWMTLEDQPPVRFGGRRLNAYALTWPLPFDLRPPENPPLARASLQTLSTEWRLRRAAFNTWEWWWDSTDPEAYYTIEGTTGQQANVVAYSAVNESTAEVIGLAPPTVTSPDGSHRVFNNSGQIIIENDTTQYSVDTQGITPAISTDNSKLTWTVRSRVTVPGQAQANSTVWVSNIDGTNAREIASVPGISGRWLDADRLLLTVPSGGRFTSLSVYDTRNESFYLLGTWRNLRNLSIAPGGGRVMFYIAFQREEDEQESGVYTIATQPEAEAEHLPWFGGWRWRDADSVYYVPFTPEATHHTLMHYDLITGETQVLAGPETGVYFTIMNGEWEVAPDGRRILFQDASDSNLWLLES